jgi:myo-inositol-1(or 4)-monophosphatase
MAASLTRWRARGQSLRSADPKKRAYVTSSDLDLRLRVAQAITRDAGNLASEYFRKRGSLVIDKKGVQDLVSEADRACEDLIVAGLSSAFPGDSFLGEEGGVRNSGGPATWVIDPIDGTHNFLTGVPFWCVSIGLVVDGEAVLGLIYHPAADELFSARSGGGAFVNGAPLRVTGETDIRNARVSVGFSFRPPVADHIRALEAILSAECGYSRLGSGALGLAYTAAGRFDGFWQRHTNSWDAAAGIVLVREAGGWTNDFLAGDGLASGNEVLAATPGLVETLAQLTGFAGRS